MPHSIALSPSAVSQAQPQARDRVHDVSRAFETVLVSQMLQSAGLNKPAEHFGGGIGEEQFASFLTEMQAQAIVQKGGLGLAQRLVVMMAQTGGHDGQ